MSLLRDQPILQLICRRNGFVESDNLGPHFLGRLSVADAKRQSASIMGGVDFFRPMRHPSKP